MKFLRTLSDVLRRGLDVLRRGVGGSSSAVARARMLQPARGFTLTELMVVVIIVSIFSGIAIPVMLQGRHERRAFGASADIAAIVREARTRAMGRGAAQLVKMEFGNGAPTRGRFTHLENADPVTREPRADGCKLANWDPAAAGTTSVQVGVFVLDGGVNDNAQIETAYMDAGVASTTTIFLCFTPAGRVYFAKSAVSNIRSAPAMGDAITLQVIRTSGGPTRTVVVSPSGATRLLTK